MKNGAAFQFGATTPQLPLAAGSTGVGGWVYYYPLARTVMGGLMTSTLLTLIVLPYINLGIESLADWAKSVWVGSAPRPVRVTPAL